MTTFKHVLMLVAALALVYTLSAVEAVHADDSATTENIVLAAVTPEASGPRPARAGERSVGNNTTLPLKFKHLAQMSVDNFDGRCTTEQIIADSAWQGYEETVVEKNVGYYVNCNAAS